MLRLRVFDPPRLEPYPLLLNTSKPSAWTRAVLSMWLFALKTFVLISCPSSSGTAGVGVRSDIHLQWHGPDAFATSLVCRDSKSLCCMYLEVREEETHEIYCLVCEPATRYIVAPDRHQIHPLMRIRVEDALSDFPLGRRVLTRTEHRAPVPSQAIAGVRIVFIWGRTEFYDKQILFLHRFYEKGSFLAWFDHWRCFDDDDKTAIVRQCNAKLAATPSLFDRKATWLGRLEAMIYRRVPWPTKEPQRIIPKYWERDQLWSVDSAEFSWWGSRTHRHSIWFNLNVLLYRRIRSISATGLRSIFEKVWIYIRCTS